MPDGLSIFRETIVGITGHAMHVLPVDVLADVNEQSQSTDSKLLCVITAD